MRMRTLLAGVVFGLLLSPAGAADNWLQYRNGPTPQNHGPRGYFPPGPQHLPPPGIDRRGAPTQFYGVPPGGGGWYDPRFHDGYQGYHGNDRRRDSRREFRREQERYGDDRRRDRRGRADERRNFDDGSYRGGFVTRQHRAPPHQHPPPAYGPYSAPGYQHYPPDYHDGYHDDRFPNRR